MTAKKLKEEVVIKEIAVLEKKLFPIIRNAEDVEITDMKSMTEATSILSNLNKAGDVIKYEKEKQMRPLLDAVNATRAFWKNLEDPYTTAVSLIRTKMTKYQTAAKNEADRQAAEIASRVKPGKGNLSVETAVKKMEEIDTPQVSVATDAGSVKFKTQQRFEVVDLRLVPVEYHLANEVLIREMMKKGIKLQGVRYFEEQIPVNFR